MLKERLAVANKLANEVHAAEAAIDNAIAKLGVLVSTTSRCGCHVFTISHSSAIDSPEAGASIRRTAQPASTSTPAACACQKG